MPVINYKDSRAALHFLVEFVGVDLASASERELSRLAFRVHSFAARDSDFKASGRTWPQDRDQKRLGEYQQHARELLEAVAHRRRLVIQGDLQLSFFGEPKHGKLRVYAMGSA